ncbi:MAG: HAMP domain-containing histidine kinase [Acidobacteria bacterium]|nr:HAMP domain-containing histidine kinase [Acidobacteriota bacterium]
MFWKIKAKASSLQFRLNLLISVAFLLSSLLVFLFVGMTLKSILMNQKDRELRSDATEFVGHYKSFGFPPLLAELKDEALTSDVEKDFYSILTGANKELFHFGPTIPIPVLAARISGDIGSGNLAFKTVKPEHDFPMRLCYVKLSNGPVLILGSSIEDIASILDEYREVFYRTVLFVLIFALLLGRFTSKQAVSGIRSVARAAEQLEKGNLTHRVSDQIKGLELVELSNSFNRMADRIQLMLREMEEVTGNVAHDLKSPLTRIRGAAESFLSKGQFPEQDDVMGLIIEESDRMINVIDTMLDIARINAGVTEMNADLIDIGDLLNKVVDLFQPMAEDFGVRLKLSVPLKPVVVSGDLQRLQRLFANLVDNGIKYSLNGGDVDLELTESGEYVEVKVQDHGIGILREERSRIFDRFYRCESSRSTPGSGLGLSLVQAIAQAHRGEILVQSSPDEGSLFTVRLPLYKK